MADTQSIQTRPDFIWLIVTVRRDAIPVRATLHHIPAISEQEARRKLARDHVCFFAGRIRQEMRHA
ncbi:host cell division inhibitor Icd-like protein [Pantoea vagans]|uniref:host cell division inhibitor Icd-like protein n=1 Tax=Pantoea vagans TaxID=470934 RepID=UPI003B010E68